MLLLLKYIEEGKTEGNIRCSEICRLYLRSEPEYAYFESILILEIAMEHTLP